MKRIVVLLLFVLTSCTNLIPPPNYSSLDNIAENVIFFQIDKESNIVYATFHDGNVSIFIRKSKKTEKLTEVFLDYNYTMPLAQTDSFMDEEGTIYLILRDNIIEITDTFRKYNIRPDYLLHTIDEEQNKTVSLFHKKIIEKYNREPITAFFLIGDLYVYLFGIDNISYAIISKSPLTLDRLSLDNETGMAATEYRKLLYIDQWDPINRVLIKNGRISLVTEWLIKEPVILKGIKTKEIENMFERSTKYKITNGKNSATLEIIPYVYDIVNGYKYQRLHLALTREGRLLQENFVLKNIDRLYKDSSFIYVPYDGNYFADNKFIFLTQNGTLYII
ncbi:MAG: hypothetical protein V1859_02870 [archaeon]